MRFCGTGICSQGNTRTMWCGERAKQEGNAGWDARVQVCRWQDCRVQYQALGAAGAMTACRNCVFWNYCCF
jgi:hypothetical protein